MVMERAHLRKCFRETGIISLLRAIEVKAAEGSPCRMRVAVCGGESDKSCYRWRRPCGSMGSSEVKR